MNVGDGASAVMPPSEPEWFERPFGDVDQEQFAVDLRQLAPEHVRRCLVAPITTRGLPGGGPDAHMAGGTVAQWIDVIVHRQEVSPSS